MKYMLVAILNTLLFVCHAQKIDTIIHQDIYTSYYSYELKGPAYVTYKLYKGGGDCNRSKLKFKKAGLPAEASDKDYRGSGYDKGHLANAEDFANDCDKQVLTFRYDNCMPQTPSMNRGIWKKYETNLRKKSQTDSLLIVCGGIFDSSTIGNKVAVPAYCWKIATQLSTGKIIFCGVFPNDTTNSVAIIDDEEHASMYLAQLFSGNISYSGFADLLREWRIAATKEQENATVQ